MTLEQVCRKYKISDSFLNSKEDALMIAALSIEELIGKLQGNTSKEVLISDLKKMYDFLKDVKNSTF